MRSHTKPLVIIGVVLVALIAIRLIVTRINQPSDQEQIQTALQESIEASREGRPGGVMDLLSANLRVNDIQAGATNQVRQFIRNSKPDVHLANKQAIVTGDEARIVSPVDLDLDYLGVKKQVHIDEATLVFHREDAREWLVIPTKKWRLSEVRVRDTFLGQFLF